MLENEFRPAVVAGIGLVVVEEDFANYVRC